MTVHIPLAKIRPNPWQTRLRENRAKILEMKDSLLANYDELPPAHRGVYQIPMARVVDVDDETRVIKGANTHELVSYIDSGQGVAQIAFGHHRLGAFRLLAGGAVAEPPDTRFAVMPMELYWLHDRQMAELAARENSERSDLSWLEKATAMNRFIADFGGSHADVAPLFGLRDKSSVSQYVRALEALKEFNAIDLLHWSEEGLLPLLHVLNLIPLLRDKPVQARQWLAANPLVNEDTGDVVSAAWIRAEVERFIPPRPSIQPADPAPESGMPWHQHYRIVADQHPGVYTFMQIGKTGSIWVITGPRATSLAEKLGVKHGTLKVPLDTRFEWTPAVAVWMGNPASESRLQALEERVGKTHTYLEPSEELAALVSKHLTTVTEFPATASAAPDQPASPPARSASTGAPYPGMPGAPAQKPTSVSATPRQIPEPPAMTDEERQAAALEKMRSIFPGGAPAAATGAKVIPFPGTVQPDAQSDTSRDVLRDDLGQAAILLTRVLEIVEALPGKTDGADAAIAEHLHAISGHTLRSFLHGVEGLLAPNELDLTRSALDAAADPKVEVRKWMMRYAPNSTLRREEKVLG